MAPRAISERQLLALVWIEQRDGVPVRDLAHVGVRQAQTLARHGYVTIRGESGLGRVVRITDKGRAAVALYKAMQPSG